MGPPHLSPMQLLCLLGAISVLPWAGALLCYEATASFFRAVTLHNWKWLLMRSMVCKLTEGCEETLLFFETGQRKGVVGFKGCTSALSYLPKTTYLISPPGVSIASYSRVCRSYLCNNLTNLEPFVKLLANTPHSIGLSSHTCPDCLGEVTKDCLPNFVTTETCPLNALKCYSSTLQFQAGSLNTTILLMGCAPEQQKLLSEFRTIGSIRVTEVLSTLERAVMVGAGPSSQGPAWGFFLGFLVAFRV
ncbi:ly6/PLAUR domain-containing protein 4 [Dasypus novemcinctus]|uniref:ly6/PLAUR domain-containing protein 4 n=1 Tax=Dasypus novemcinctus TaxID=9361 RepID=UPI000328B5C1|nr:ly6/PLAUR domain-containing protein 4 [Dasypus novemcinctus]